ncbi:hypothetical protein BGZ65_010135, partial [Modicella reniformis]
YNTELALHLLPQFLPRVQQQQQQQLSQEGGSQPSFTLPKIQFLTIFLGANDSCTPPSPQHVELNRYEQNIRTLIDMVHSPTSPTYSPETRIILICPPPVDEPRYALQRKEQGIRMDRDKDVTRQYAETCLRIGREYQAKNGQQQPEQHCQLDVIDTWGLVTERVERGQGTMSDYLNDGLHLASAGNDLIFEQIMKIIRGRYPEWDPDTLPMNTPWWRDLKDPKTELLLCANKI